ncbi:dicarboxylate/amino acid:cation symporter [Aeromonas veronii]
MFGGDYADKGALPDAVATLLGMIPTNVFQSLNEANILQILALSMFLFGIALAKQPRERAKPLVDGLNTLVDAFVWMISKVMIIAPLGVFGLMADAIGTYGFDVLTLVLKLFVVYVAAILIFGFVVYPLLVALFSNTPVMTYISAMKKPQIVAFSTASSMATLPVNMETCEQDLKVTNATASFVLPLGATINERQRHLLRTGRHLLAQVYNIDLSVGAWAAIIVTATRARSVRPVYLGLSFLVVAVLLAQGSPLKDCRCCSRWIVCST